MKRPLLIIGLISLCAFWFYFFYTSYGFLFFVSDQQIIKLVLKENLFAKAKKEMVVEVAKTQQSITQGLSLRHDLTSTTGQKIDGLLFILPKKTIQQFWMKDMLFDIDICWLSGSTFLSCERTATAPLAPLDSQNLTIYRSPAATNLVLETAPNFLSEAELKLKPFFKW